MSAGLHAPAAADRPANDRKWPEDRLPEHNESQRHNPIILLSACPRSGSNYLENLLSLHPQCRKSKVPEDFFLANSETLLNFCRSVADSWDDWWLQRLGGPSRLAMHIGTALLRFADPGPEEEGPVSDFRLMLRSPTTEGIAAATTLFPDARVLVLVRDGPATVELGRRSFRWPYEEAMLAWRQSVRRILSFLASADGPRCQLIRFEDLTADPAREIARVIAFLGLDPALYAFDRVDEIPVLGSSSFGRTEGEGGPLAAGAQGFVIRSLGESAVMAGPSARAVRLAGGGGAAQARLSRSPVVANGSRLECRARRHLRGSSHRDPNRFAPPQRAAGVQ